MRNAKTVFSKWIFLVSLLLLFGVFLLPQFACAKLTTAAEDDSTVNFNQKGKKGKDPSPYVPPEPTPTPTPVPTPTPSEVWPCAYTGYVYFEGAPVPDNTGVRALLDGTVLGETTTGIEMLDYNEFYLDGVLAYIGAVVDFGIAVYGGLPAR